MRTEKQTVDFLIISLMKFSIFWSVYEVWTFFVRQRITRSCFTVNGIKLVFFFAKWIKECLMCKTNIEMTIQSFILLHRVYRKKSKWIFLLLSHCLNVCANVHCSSPRCQNELELKQKSSNNELSNLTRKTFSWPYMRVCLCVCVSL